jgi:hypothetical protein
VQLSPSAYQAIRRNPADFNQALRDFIATTIGDNHAEMTGTITSTMHGLETHPLLQPTTPLVVKLPHPKTTSLH